MKNRACQTNWISSNISDSGLANEVASKHSIDLCFFLFVCYKLFLIIFYFNYIFYFLFILGGCIGSSLLHVGFL